MDMVVEFPIWLYLSSNRDLVGKGGGMCRVVPRAYVALEVVAFCSSSTTPACPFATA